MEVLAVCATFIGILFLTLTGVSHAQIEIALEPAEGAVKHGDTLTVTCTAEDLDPVFGWIRLARIVGDKQYSIADGTALEPVFKNTGRYSVVAAGSTATMTITDIQGEDGGSIACVKMSGGEAAAETVTVSVPPKSVTLMAVVNGTKMPLEGDRPIEFSEMRSAGFACEVEVDGSKEAPTVKIMIDDEDITNSFMMTDAPKEEINHGLVYKSNIVSLTMENDEPDIDHNGKVITCEAVTEGFDPVSDSAEIMVSYGPRAECEETQLAEIGHTDVQLACNIKMHPFMDDLADAVWSWGKKGNRTQISSLDGPVDGFTASVGEPDGDARDFILTIAEVTEEHFRKYRLDLGNTVNTLRVMKTLEKAPETTTTMTTTTTQPPTTKNRMTPSPVGGACATQVPHVAIFLVAVFMGLLAGRL